MAVYAYELYNGGEKTGRGIISDSDCESAHDFYLWLTNRPLPADEVRVWVGQSTAGHPVVVRQRRRQRGLQAVGS